MQIMFEIAGFHFRKPDEKIALQIAEPGAEVRLEREPENAYDSNAIKLLMKDDDGNEQHVGYIPRHSNRDLAKIMDGDGVEAELMAEGHEPEITCHLHDMPGGKPDKSIFVVEVTTGFEVPTEVVEPTDED